MPKTKKETEQPASPKNRVEELRKLRGMTQDGLARKVGTGKQSIYKIEKGLGKLTQDNAPDYARALGVQPGDLFPIITDGSVPLPGVLSRLDLETLHVTLALFFQVHTDFGAEDCDRMAKAAVKMFLFARKVAESQTVFDLEALKDILVPDPSTD